MKLQLDEIVEHPDADLVLRTLEPYLREVSLETIRRGDELIVYGLGPSFRPMNHNDKTVVLATSQPSATVIHTEANFLASALMGDIAQDDIVRSKIERAFESLKTALNSDTVSHRTASRTPQISEPVSTGTAYGAVSGIAKAYSAPPVDAEQIPLPPIERAHNFSRQPSIEQRPARKADEPVLTAPHRSAPVRPSAKIEAGPLKNKKRRSGILLLLPLFVILIVAGYFFLQHRGSSQNRVASKSEEQTAISTGRNNLAAQVPPSSSSLTGPAQSTPTEMPKDIKAWVEAWAAAMRTHDVQSQLSFYATPVDRYFLSSDVSREQLLKDKQSEIKNRRGLWTFKAERVFVQKETPTNAVVVLFKHIIVEFPSSTIQEERIKTQLKLKMVGEGWKITSERTIS